MARALIGLAFILAAAAVGCGGGGKQQDMNVARDSLQAALDAWKAGSGLESLKTRTPPVDFTDTEQQAGFKLLNYEITSVKPYEQVIHCATTLSVQDRAGKALERKVTYAVSVKTPVVIARDPFF